MSIDAFDSKRRLVFTRRATLLGGGATLLFGGVGARLYQLQVSQHELYQRYADDNQFNTRVVTPLRGEIVDRYGMVLAANRKNFRVLIVPEESHGVEAAIEQLSDYIDLTEERQAKILRMARRNPNFIPIEVADNLDWDAFARINVDGPNLPGVIPEAAETRDYPLGPAAAFVVGYVGAVTESDLKSAPDENTTNLLRQPGFRVGREGLERTYEDELRGEAGAMMVQVNAHGRVIEEYPDRGREPTQGATLSLTIDAELQEIAIRELGEESGAAVVIDVVTGDILVLASTPAFDPNKFNVGVTSDQWEAWRVDPYKPLLNKTLQGAYPPGSTFKLVTALAAQEAGIKPTTRFHCSGKLWYGNRFFSCWKRGGHGSVDMRGSIKHSCDVYYYNLAQRVDVDLIADVGRRLGLGEIHDLGIPGQKTGVIPDREWKRAFFSGNPAQQTWFPGETLSVAIGQGYVNTTPLQLAVMTARIATGKAVSPRIVRTVGPDVLTPEPAPEIDVDPDALAVVRGGMDAVTNDWGTAWRSRLEEPEWRLAGKTGTSQVRSLVRDPRTGRVLKNDELPWNQRDHALFVCYAPFHAPRYACAVVVEHGGGGSAVAGPKAREIMRAVMTRDPANKPLYQPKGSQARTASAGVDTGEAG